MKRTGHLRSAAVFAAVCGFAVGQSAGSERPLREATAQRRLAASDAAFLHGAVQLTRRADFLRAGEAYFSPDQRWIIFQATPVPPEGEEPTPHYEMYAAPLLWDGEPGAADARVAGLGEIVQLSKPGSANTCGWFHPTEPGRNQHACPGAQACGSPAQSRHDVGSTPGEERADGRKADRQRERELPSRLRRQSSVSGCCHLPSSSFGCSSFSR